MTGSRLILDDMGDGVNRLMNLASTKIQVLRDFFLFSGCDQLIHKFADAFVFARGNRHDRNPQKFAELFHMDRIAAGPYLVHHVEGDDHGLAQLHQLEGQIEISLDVGGIHDIENAIRIFIQDKVAGDDLLGGVR